MNVVGLMAGSDHTFEDAGFRYPKNLVEVAGRPLIERVTDWVSPLKDAYGAQFTFMVKSVEVDAFHTDDVLDLLIPGALVIPVREETGGAACTALLAIEHINNDDELIVFNGDMIVDIDLTDAVADFRSRDLDGGIVVFDAVHPRWSYVKLEDGLVVETAEKRPISRMATAGIYYFRQGREFVQAAFQSIRKGAEVGGQFYVCPVYNEMILGQRRIGVFEVPSSAYHSMADPRGVSEYEKHYYEERGTHVHSPTG